MYRTEPRMCNFNVRLHTRQAYSKHVIHHVHPFQPEQEPYHSTHTQNNSSTNVWKFSPAVFLYRFYKTSQRKLLFLLLKIKRYETPYTHTIEQGVALLKRWREKYWSWFIGKLCSGLQRWIGSNQRNTPAWTLWRHNAYRKTKSYIWP